MWPYRCVACSVTDRASAVGRSCAAKTDDVRSGSTLGVRALTLARSLSEQDRLSAQSRGGRTSHLLQRRARELLEECASIHPAYPIALPGRRISRGLWLGESPVHARLAGGFAPAPMLSGGCYPVIGRDRDQVTISVDGIAYAVHESFLELSDSDGCTRPGPATRATPTRPVRRADAGPGLPGRPPHRRRRALEAQLPVPAVRPGLRNRDLTRPLAVALTVA